MVYCFFFYRETYFSTHFDPKHIKKYSKNLDKPINGLKQSKKPPKKLKINLK